MLRTIAGDAAGLVRVCGPGTGARWLWSIVANLRSCIRAGNLQPADAAMGDGPFPVRLGAARAELVGRQAMSGLRDLWVRDAYGCGGFLTIRDGDTIVDLGSNMGNFTLLALGAAPATRVVAVEANKAEAARWRRGVEHNGWRGRATLVNAFIGAATADQEALRRLPECDGVPFIDERELIRAGGITRVDLLKCDIEGSEFGLLRPGGALLGMARQVAVEVHANAGAPAEFERMLVAEGFEVRATRRSPSADILVGRRATCSRSASLPPPAMHQ